MRLVIDLGGQKVEELHPSEELARTHLSIVLQSHKSRGHHVARRHVELARGERVRQSRFIVQTPEGALQYWLER
jgi:hypothetical protein